MSEPQCLTAILPCTDLAASLRFYNRLGFFENFEKSDKSEQSNEKSEKSEENAESDYRMLADGRGGFVHLRKEREGWVRKGENPFGVYLYRENVDELAHEFGNEIIEKGKKAEDKVWGMYEFSLSDPDGVLVRVGWPTRLRKKE
eukprot:Phypoly_transcript_22747.p1 GENE.Phypoly_transcript_22747~~Phypoly_transcript_22747.p1  ORF type:complete len:144 (+),score=41.80 Phypoly_transcript_22747:129-560(+)